VLTQVAELQRTKPHGQSVPFVMCVQGLVAQLGGLYDSLSKGGKCHTFMGCWPGGSDPGRHVDGYRLQASMTTWSRRISLGSVSGCSRARRASLSISVQAYRATFGPKCSEGSHVNESSAM